jgi:Pyruvate/2-oxoacid:ferredoxin oxidoreductase delta subunit
MGIHRGVNGFMAGYDPKKANPTSIIPEAPAKITRKKKKPKEIAVVIPDNCTGCEACVSFCPVDCIELTPRDNSDGTNVIVPNVQIRFDECIGCKICVNVCERMAWDAIEMWPADQVESYFGIKLHDKYEEAVAAYEAEAAGPGKN